MRKIFTLRLAAAAALSASAAAPRLVQQQIQGPTSVERTAPIKMNDAQLSHDQQRLQDALKYGERVKKQSRGEDDVIWEAPAGTTTYYNVSNEGFYVYWYWLTYGNSTGATKFVETEDNEVYILNPIISYATGAYIKGTKDGDKITAQLPQQIDFYSWPDYYDIDFYVSKMHYETVWSSYYQEYVEDYVPVADEDNVIVWNIQEDGTIVMDTTGWEYDYTYDEDGYLVYPEYMFGEYHIYSDEPESIYWSAGDWSQTYTPYDLEANLVQVPEGVEFSDSYVITDENDNSRNVEVAIDGNDVYFRNFTSYVPDGVFKGTLDENNVLTVPTHQPLGFYEAYGYIICILGTNGGEEDEYGDVSYTFQDLKFNYDPESLTFTSANDQVLWVNASLERIYYISQYVNPRIFYQTEEMVNANPLDPEFLYFNEDYGYGDQYGWYIPNINVNGALLDTSRMYYNIYANYELYEFYTDTYTDFPYDMIDIPYDFTDGWDIYYPAPELDLYLHDSGIDVIGCQSFYVGTDGITYASNAVHVNIEEFLGINVAKANTEVKSVEYFNIAGQRVANPKTGLFIKATTYTDGTRRVEKVAIK
ncbi:MAG: hypothetical protein LUD17_13140 [Bacteroidales bacterium]|nr:hypothetical protein [Bacteroidales bacterium]